jgi:hypothetical protein
MLPLNPEDFATHVELHRPLIDANGVGLVTESSSTQQERLLWREMLQNGLINARELNGENGAPVAFGNITITMAGREFVAAFDRPKVQPLTPEQHTLWNYWERADRGQRFGMLSFFWGLILFGFGLGRLCDFSPKLNALYTAIKSLMAN